MNQFNTDKFNGRDLTGFKVNRISVVGLNSIRERSPSSKKKVAFWNCECDCGAVFVVRGHCLTKSKPQKSCGCYLDDQNKKRTVHGMVGHPLYSVWTGMKSRCSNPNNKSYGGRGIKVCPEWNDFSSFFRDMERGYEAGLSIERVDNNGDYCKANCIWATDKTQSRNRTTSRLITASGIIMPLCEWSEILGISRSTINSRMRSGWTPEQAVTTPRRKYESV